MFIAHLASCMFVKIPMAALVLVQSSGGAQRFDLWQMWLHMQWPARSIAIILLGMSAWSMGVMMDRWLAFRAARKQSRQVCPDRCRRVARRQTR
jgi:hypothetical protein